MSIFIIQPGEKSPLEQMIPALSPHAAAVLAHVHVRRVEVNTEAGAWRVHLHGEQRIAPDVLREVEAGLRRLVTNIRHIEVVDIGATSRATDERPTEPDLDAGVADDAYAAPTEPPPTADADDEYLDRILQRAANGPVLAPVPNRSDGPSSNGNSLFQNRIAGEPTPLAEVREPQRDCVIEGRLLTWETRDVRGGHLLMFDVTDLTDSITVKAFARGEAPTNWPVRVGETVRVRGRVELDRYSQELVLSPRAVAKVEPTVRTDEHPEKRVELHLHTKMSSLDGAADTEAIITQAAAWGHPAVAVTDHGVVHAFPEAYNVAKRHGIKLIFGVEGYLVDDDEPRGRSYHIIILAKNETGLRHLYELVSLSHLDHFYRQPRIPRSEIEKRREGLIVGSACEAGELYQAVLNGESRQLQLEIASFYDYLEIQPVANNGFLVEQGVVEDEDGLRAINVRISELAAELNKPLIATCDAHFVHPEDEIFRRIIMAGHGFSAAENPTPLYLRTTAEMLEEFAYLGAERAREAVIEFPNEVAASCKEMPPVPEGLHTPHMPESADEVATIAKKAAIARYGEPLPEIVASRLQRELDAIIDNGYAPLYYISYLLVKKSLEDGYLVGSRGSVGSSLVATLCGITEVNPLLPHYACPACQWSEFITDGSVGCGIDLPAKRCPECGTHLDKDGFDIPFETFMGFHGEKVPDIDLNFSGEYQSRAHQYAEALLGEENVYRAGTIATLAERTAYGYVRNFLDAQGKELRAAEVNRLVRGCSGVRRTTGQHPGGLIVVPQGRDIHEFTPVQYPANDRDAGVTTTHFDFSALQDNLVKLDILGHDDPTILRMLGDMTGVDVQNIPLNDPGTMAIFSGLESLGVTAGQINSKVGTLGVPEFGTGFVRQMLEETRPSTFAELVRISGLSHGTNVWLNNAQDLIRRGTATLVDVIATRDDIMTYLIPKGMDAADAFRIMEQVRRGRGLTPEDEKLMREHGLPDWYIDSCHKISYMFPKAHAAAYVMMAFRIAYFKVHHPEAFYAAALTVRAEGCDAQLIMQGREQIRQAVVAVERKGQEATARERSLVTTMQIVLEAMARDVNFLAVDLYESDPRQVLLTDGGLLLPLISLQGVGANAAMSIAAAREEGEFSSIEDIRKKAKVTRSVIDALREHGALAGLPETDQLTLF